MTSRRSRGCARLGSSNWPFLQGIDRAAVCDFTHLKNSNFSPSYGARDALPLWRMLAIFPRSGHSAKSDILPAYFHVREVVQDVSKEKGVN